MDIKNIKEHTGWYASYTSGQTKSLILCQQKKIVKLEALISTIQAETEIWEDPKLIISSIEELCKSDTSVEATVDYFQWKG